MKVTLASSGLSQAAFTIPGTTSSMFEMVAGVVYDAVTGGSYDPQSNKIPLEYLGDLLEARVVVEVVEESEAPAAPKPPKEVK